MSAHERTSSPRPAPQERNSSGASAAAHLPPASEITAMQQSHHDEWAVIDTENCSLVTSEVWSGDSMSPKWNQSPIHVQFILSYPFCCENIVSFVPPAPSTNTHTPTVPFLLWNEPFHLNPNHPQWDQWVVQWRNMAISPPPFPGLHGW